MKYTFLHLSDLHYRPAWAEEMGLVCRKFTEDLALQIKRFENPFVIFSGDLVLAGADPKLYTAFHSAIADELDKIGLRAERRISVPGNHDISRDALKPLLVMQKGALAESTEERLFNDQLPEFSKAIFGPKFSNYVEYERNFAQYTCCSPSLGGAGWELSSEVGVYCLNTALCSFGGLEDASGKPISDQNRLMVDTRSLHAWLANSKFKTRILVMHHPLDWLAEWSKIELEKIIAESFQLVFSGHVHQSSATFSCRGLGRSVHFIAPQLFSRKVDPLGYAFVTLETSDGTASVDYRQWSQSHVFVNGSGLAGTDSGGLVFAPSRSAYVPVEILPPITKTRDTLEILQAEFDEARTCYSSKKQIWVDRDLAKIPETASNRDSAILLNQDKLIENMCSRVIRAPKQFGLTCLGRYLALACFRKNSKGEVIAMVDALEMPHHRQGVIQHIENRCEELRVNRNALRGIILDNWHNDKHGSRIVRELEAEFPGLPIFLLVGIDDCAAIGDTIEAEEVKCFETVYLWALTRTRVRELVIAYIDGLDSLDDNVVAKRVTADIDALNIHRTPMNCLLILKWVEEAFDESPVNRTEMIGRVLYLLFYQFDKIPRYASRPDLKDCEYALGFFCEGLIRTGKSTFTKNEFFAKIQEYCKAQIFDLDVEVLFAFLESENILIRKGYDFGFRFNYWLHYFAAHRMLHDADFAEFILSDGRYAAYPEIIEFYAGIDRRRTDAIVRLTDDLKRMNEEFLKRTGIPADFNPFRGAKWEPREDELVRLKEEVTKSMEESALPAVVKDGIADQSYDRARPYNQALAQFIKDSSLRQLIQAMRGAARALRNSDHVSPTAKTALLEEVMSCWMRVCQILAIISPVLASERSAVFEDICFILVKEYDQESFSVRFQEIMTAIVDNVVAWFQEDLFSKKMGALLGRHVRTHENELGELLVLLVMIKQRPPRWEQEVERFIVREKKNTYYLHKVFTALRCEHRIGFSTERTRQELRRLAAMSLAKHETGAKHPNISLVKKAAKVLDEHDASAANAADKV